MKKKTCKGETGMGYYPFSNPTRDTTGCIATGKAWALHEFCIATRFFVLQPGGGHARVTRRCDAAQHAATRCPACGVRVAWALGVRTLHTTQF